MKAAKAFCRVLVPAVAVASLLLPMGAAARAATPPVTKNVIVMIGDGMGYNQTLAGSYYRFGAAGMQIYCGFPFQFAESTFSTDGWGYDPALAWSDFNYVKTHYTDSAAAATAMATGVKTYDAGIGVDPDGKPLENVFQAAEGIGKSTGVVTTVEFSHATPAGFVAHNVSRDDYAGIAQEMVLDSKTDVIMGAGNPWFNNSGLPITTPNTYKYVGGQALWDSLVAGTVQTDTDGDGVDETATLIQDRAAFQALMAGPTPERVIGVAQAYTTMQQARSGDTMADAYVVPRTTTVPTLTEMALGAINVLDDNPNGFALMVEGGAIDWAAHSNQPGRTIEEQIDFDKAVEAVVAWIEANSNWGETLLIVTGDHETGYLTGPGSGAGSDPMWKPIVNNGAGVQPGMQFNSPNHTNSLIRMYAKGSVGRLFKTMVAGTDPVRGNYVDNTSIAKVVFDALGVAH